MVKRVGAYLQWLFRKEYRVAEFTNELTNETYWFIEERTYWFWRTHRIKNPVYQQKFGCDKDGMFGKMENVRHVISFLRGQKKLIKRIRKDV